MNNDISLDIYGRVHEASPSIQKSLDTFVRLNRNVRFLGPYDNDDIQNIFTNYSIGILPYEVNAPMTRYVNPDKLYHYLNFGLEVLAAPIPEIERHKDYLYTIEREGDWKLALSDIAKTSRAFRWPREQYSWDERWRELRDLAGKRSLPRPRNSR